MIIFWILHPNFLINVLKHIKTFHIKTLLLLYQNRTKISLVNNVYIISVASDKVILGEERYCNSVCPINWFSDIKVIYYVHFWIEHRKNVNMSDDHCDLVFKFCCWLVLLSFGVWEMLLCVQGIQGYFIERRSHVQLSVPWCTWNTKNLSVLSVCRKRVNLLYYFEWIILIVDD